MPTGQWLPDVIERIATANSQAGGGLVIPFEFLIPDAATADYDIIVDNKIEVIDVIVRKDGAGAGNTIQIKNTATAISDAIVAAVDKAVTRAGQLTAAATVVAAGGILRCTATKAAGSMASLVTVLAIVRP